MLCGVNNTDSQLIAHQDTLVKFVGFVIDTWAALYRVNCQAVATVSSLAVA